MANQNVFTRSEVDFGGAMTSEKGLIVPNGGLTGVLMQNWNLMYAQNVTRIYEIGTAGKPTRVYYIGGRAQGQVSAGHIVGPGLKIRQFYDQFGDVCNARTNDFKIDMGPNACANNIDAVERQAYNAKFCVLTSIGLSVSAQEFVISENAQIMFSALHYDESSPTGNQQTI